MRKVGLVVAAVVAVAGCGSPRVTSLALQPGETEGIESADLGEDALAQRTLSDGETDGRFELPAMAVGAAYDRVGLTWESYDAGGTSAFEAKAGASWIPITLDFSEFVPADGVTLYAGHVDVPMGSEPVLVRAVLSRGHGADGLTASPQLRGVHLEAFARDGIAEAGGPVDPGAVDTFATVTSPSIVTRAQWGARAPKCEGSAHTPYRMTFHHTETPNGESGDAAKSRMRQMQAFHQDTRGWCDIGYHFSVDWAGQVYQGRDTTDRTASHVGGQNTGNIGVSLMGSFDDTTPPAAQVSGLEKIFAFEASKYGVTVDADHVKGHQQWPGQSTSCPGTKLLAQKASILAAVVSILNGGTGGGTGRPIVLVDNTDPGFHVSGSWWNSSQQPDRYGTNYAVRNTCSLSDPASWDADLAGGNYEAFVWYSQGTSRASGAPYFVEHAGGQTKVIVNEQTNGGRWVSLGTYNFAAGSSTRVMLSCWTNTGTYVIADAIKLVPVD